VDELRGLALSGYILERASPYLRPHPKELMLRNHV
jgi:hypothetical protein